MTKKLSMPCLHACKDLVGIVAYGAYIPHNRITVKEIARTWHKDGVHIEQQLGVVQKAVASSDEDAATIAITASQRAINSYNFNRSTIGAVYVGSESHPYAVKPTSSIVADALQIGHSYTAADLQFACKAGTASFLAAYGLVASGICQSALAIGADTAQACPGDMLEYTAASGGAAVILGSDPKKIIARVIAITSYTSDTPDFWRRACYSFPSHAGRFTQEPGYMHHVQSATEHLLHMTGLAISDIDHIIFHQPNQKLPRMVARCLGVAENALQYGLLVKQIGNTYAGAVLLGLSNVLEHAQPHELILMVSYGSGAGSDAILLQTTEQIGVKRSAPSVTTMLADTKQIDYAQYAICRKLLKGEHD
jgi:hydroxymethylglutaryl-CoA synthase